MHKIVVRSLAMLVCLAATSWLLQWAWTQYEERPVRQSELWGVKIGDSSQEIRFKKGKPQQEENPDTGLEYTYITKDFGSIVRFKNQKVRAVILYNTPKGFEYSDLQGIQVGDTSEKIIARFGDSPLISNSKDDLKRIYAYPKYQVFFGLDTNKVEIFGIYDPLYPLPVGFEDPDEKK